MRGRLGPTASRRPPTFAVRRVHGKARVSCGANSSLSKWHAKCQACNSIEFQPAQNMCLSIDQDPDRAHDPAPRTLPGPYYVRGPGQVRGEVAGRGLGLGQAWTQAGTTR